MTKLTDSSLRIIGGQWRSRKITFTGTDGLRPTGDRVRETLFNWLAPHLAGAHCLDLFAGSGVLCLESLSREAKTATAVENNQQALKNLTAAKNSLQADNLTIINADALEWLQHCKPDKPSYDVVFIDPPFSDRLVQTAIQYLDQGLWIKPQGLIYIEQDKTEAMPTLPTQWQPLKSKTTGNITFHLYQLGD